MSKQTELVDWGLDYLRATDDEDKWCSDMFEAGRVIMLQDGELGYEPKPGGQLGFYGRRTRHCFFGVREKWSMLQVSGHRCREHWSSLLDSVRHVTRIDLQVTVKVGEASVAKKIAEAESGSLAAKPINGRHWQTTAISKNGHKQTVYIGSRSSEWFGRVYDKYAEDGKEEHRGCVRYELELKGDAANSVWSQMRGPGGVSLMVRLIVEWFAQHGIEIDFEPPANWSYIRPVKEQTSAQRTVAWFYKQVSSAVARMADEGYIYETFHALFHKLLACEEISAIMHVLSVVQVTP